jgi:hypothetical protein
MLRSGLSLLVVTAVAGGALSACVGNIGNPPDETTTKKTPICADGAKHPGAAPIRRMTRFEYDNTLRDLLGDTTHPSKPFPAEEEAGGFNNNAANLVVSDDLADKYMIAAEGVSDRATKDIDALTGCADQYVDGCAATFIEKFGKRAFRRPLTDDERADLFAVYQAGFSQSKTAFAQDRRRDNPRDDFRLGIRMVIEAAIQSPEFLYRVEPVDPSAGKDDVVTLDSYEMASRLSFFLWGSMPDDALFAAADAGALATKEQVADQARRMLDDARARLAVGEFHAQWLGYERVVGATKDPALFPDFSPAIAAMMQEETRLFIDHTVFDEGGDLRTLLTAPYTFVNADLAAFYGVSAAGASGTDWVRVDYDPSQHAGILTEGAIMTWYAHTNQTSPVHRGKLVRERFLCGTLSPPPINFNAPDVDPNATTRQRFAQHDKDPACASCHKLMDPIGFGFENIDAVGRYRATENGAPVDASGELTQSDVDGTFSGAIGLADKLAGSAEVEQCYTTEWFRWTQGRGDTAEDECTISQVGKAFSAANGDIKSLVVALTQTDAFLYRKNGEMP